MFPSPHSLLLHFGYHLKADGAGATTWCLWGEDASSSALRAHRGGTVGSLGLWVIADTSSVSTIASAIHLESNSTFLSRGTTACPHVCPYLYTCFYTSLPVGALWGQTCGSTMFCYFNQATRFIKFSSSPHYSSHFLFYFFLNNGLNL